MRFRPALWLLAALLTMGCASPPAPTPAPDPAPAKPAVRDALKVTVLAAGLEAPWSIAPAPDGRLFITERPGRIRVIRDGKLQPEPWATLPVVTGSEAGLFGIALDPAFSKNGWVYVAYTYDGGRGEQHNTLVRLREDPATGKGVRDLVLADQVPAARNHDGGRVKFGPDGKLYWTLGDAQAASSAQDPKVLACKILRLNPDGTAPSDNPFPGSPVWSYGHRNPQGLAWQPGTGRLYATEHGPSGEHGVGQDEVNLIEPGRNYGWPAIAGDETSSGMISPVIHSTKSDTWAPTGMTFVSRGPWAGSLVFTGLRGQSLFRLQLDPHNPSRSIKLDRYLRGAYGRLRDVVEASDGSLYVLTSNRDGRGSPASADDRLLRVVVNE